MSFLGSMGGGAAIAAAFVTIRPDTSSFQGELDSGVRPGLAGMADRVRQSMTEAGEEGGSRLAAGLGAGIEIAKENAAVLGAAFTAAGVGVEAWARSQQDANVELGRLATATGMTEGELRGLVGQLDNVTFSTDDVIAVLSNASQQGIRSAEDMADFARTWDLVADATGESVVALSDAGVALQALDIDNPADALDAFGFIAQETTGSVAEFLQFVERTGPQLRELNLDVDDTAAIMGVLERELGLTGRTARTEFRKAVSEADGDLGVMLETLGVTPEAFAAMRAEVEGSGEVLERNAEIYADSFTPLQRLQSWVGETAFQFGGMADAAGIAAGALTAVGPAVMAVAHAGPAMSALGTATGHVRGAMVALRTVMMAHPIMTFAAVAGGVVAAFSLLRGGTDHLKDRVDSLATSIQNANTVAEGLTEHVVGLASDFDPLSKAMAAADVSAAEMAEAFRKGGDDQARMTERLKAGADAAGLNKEETMILGAVIRDLEPTLDRAIDKTGEMEVINRGVSVAAQEATAAHTEFAAGMREVAETAATEQAALDELVAAHTENTAMMREAMEAGRELDDSWHTLNETLGLTHDELVELADVLGDVDVAAAMSEAAMGVVNDAMAEVEAKAGELRDRVDSAFKAGAASIMKFSDDGKQSLGAFRRDADQNIVDLTVWQDNLIAIAERGGAGFALQMAELGPEFSGVVAELSGTTDDEFAAVMASMVGMTDATQRDMAAEFAKVDPEFKKTLDGVAGMTKLEMAILEMNASQEAFRVGQALASGMEAGIGAGAGAIAARAAQTVRDAMAAARTAGEVGSPSKLFAREVGLPIAQGIAVGIASGQRDIDAALMRSMETDGMLLDRYVTAGIDELERAPQAAAGPVGVGDGVPRRLVLSIGGREFEAFLTDRFDDVGATLSAGRRP